MLMPNWAGAVDESIARCVNYHPLLCVLTTTLPQRSLRSKIRAHDASCKEAYRLYIISYLPYLVGVCIDIKINRNDFSSLTQLSFSFPWPKKCKTNKDISFPTRTPR